MYPNIAQLAERPTVESHIRRDRAVPGSTPGVRMPFFFILINHFTKLFLLIYQLSESVI